MGGNRVSAEGTPARAPRVLVSGVVLAQPEGGVRRHNAELLPRLARLLSEGGGSLAVLEGKDPVPFALPDSVERIASEVPAGPPILRAAREGRALARAAREAQAAGCAFDLVHTAHLPVPRSLPVPITLTIHDLRSLDLAHTPLSRKLFARTVIGHAVTRAATVFVVSETVRARLLEGWPLAPERVIVVPNAVDHLTVLPRAPARDAPLLHVGHVEPRKNLELLLHALAADASLPALVLAGRAKGIEGTRLARVADELGITERVTFRGAFDDAELPELYARAACVVLPSHLEGFGIVALEAQRAGVPLAVSDTGALREVAGDDVPHFAPDDPAACVRAIHAALESDADTRASHARAAMRFSWDASARLWFDGLCSALA
jgi:glycosyltransferase involved in cell wall biosynthesis